VIADLLDVLGIGHEKERAENRRRISGWPDPIPRTCPDREQGRSCNHFPACSRPDLRKATTR
jgi:hypothetical protein